MKWIAISIGNGWVDRLKKLNINPWQFINTPLPEWNGVIFSAGSENGSDARPGEISI
ncbi:hypothetical protein QB898_00310 [Ottowia sp. 10c7w1]|uniref:Uncharacterized protein n=1 Tax=Ottowia cancrivicina TaxID=3040346 RepID=A0AAW6RHS1_9BURK|nr:hypothetical protein [Ottowia sp. 10c7w1]